MIVLHLKYLLEKYYNVNVSAMYVVCFHPDVGDKPFVDEVPVMTTEVEAMMEVQRKKHAGVHSLVEHDI